jgi:hypothetical protein
MNVQTENQELKNQSQLLAIIFNASGILPGLQIAYFAFYFSLFVFLVWMSWKRKGFDDKGNRGWLIALLLFNTIFALLFFVLNILLFESASRSGIKVGN